MNMLDFPLFWWVDFMLVVVLIGEAMVKRRQAWPRPAIAVYLTATVWYLGDYAYSDPDAWLTYPDWAIDSALIQVGAFLVTFRLMLAMAVRKSDLIKPGPDVPVEFPQPTMNKFLSVLAGTWIVIFIIGLALVNWKLLAVLWPPSVPERVGMFAHTGMGGSTGFLMATAGYIYLAICAFFGIGFAMSRGTTQMVFGLLILLSWPYFLFDRTRNTMLALMMPGILCFALMGRASVVKKGVLLATFALAINFWFLIVVNARGAEGGVTGRFETVVENMLSSPEDEQDSSATETERHYGLDMLKELCYINMYIDDGTYKVNYGRRYLAEFLNFVPRAIWKGKPMIGIDYAVARGFGGADGGVGVFATVATGLIGQGVVNFGTILGTGAAAALMTIWCVILARLWTQRFTFPRAALFVLGLGLTFNMGRDITLLVLWPFVFAYGGVRLAERNLRPAATTEAMKPRTRPRISRPLAPLPARRR